MTFDTNVNPIKKQAPPLVPSDRSFGLVFMFFFLAVAAWPLLTHSSVRMWSIALAISFGVVSILMPSLLHSMNLVWAKFGDLLHKLLSPVVLGIMFFLVLTPVGLLLKAFGKDILHLKHAPEKETYWIIKNMNEYKSSMRDQF